MYNVFMLCRCVMFYRKKEKGFGSTIQPRMRHIYPIGHWRHLTKRKLQHLVVEDNFRKFPFAGKYLYESFLLYIDTNSCIILQ